LQTDGQTKQEKGKGLAFVIAVCCFIGALLLFILGALIRWSQGHSQPASLLFSLSFSGIVFSSIWIFSKGKNGELLPRHNRLELMSLFAFPALVWILSTPVLSFLEKQVSLFLLSQVISVVFTIFEVMGLFVEQRGNTLVLPNGVVGVADACSGIRSLMACIFAGSFLGAVFLGKFWKKLIFVGLACIFAFLFNIFRSLFLTFWAYKWGADSIKGQVHDITGFAVLGFTGLCLLVLVPVLEGRWIRD
jgi:exosortase